MAHEFIIEKLVNRVAKLPTVGRKSATKIVYSLLNGDKEVATALLAELQLAVDKVKPCKICNNLSEYEICGICSNEARLHSQRLIIVEDPLDIPQIEQLGIFDGVYFVTNQIFNPLTKEYSNRDTLLKLISLISNYKIKEVILAVDNSAGSDMVAEVVNNVCKKVGASCSKFATGLPTGARFSNVDQNTILQSYLNRINVED